MLARMRMANGQWGEAIILLENYIAQAPNDAECHKSFAEIAMVWGRWTDAWLQLERSRSLVDGMKFEEQRKQDFLSELIKLRGEVAEQRKDIETATKLFESLAQRQTDSGDPLWALGRIKISQGKIDDGIELLRRAKSLSSHLPQPELAVAIELSLKGKKEGAEEWFESSLKADHAKQVNWSQYARFLIEDDRHEQAFTLLEKAPSEYQSDRDFKMLKGVLYRYKNDIDNAEDIFSELHRANPNDLESADQLALVLVESEDEGKRARAQQISEANLRQAPNVERVIATAAWIKFKTGASDIAERLLNQIIRNGRINSQTAFYMAEIFRSLGKNEDAAKFYSFAIDASGSFPEKQSAKEKLASLAPKTK